MHAMDSCLEGDPKIIDNGHKLGNFYHERKKIKLEISLFYHTNV